MFIRAYLRASTAEQDSLRAKQQLTDFATAHGHQIASYYTENASGAKLHRPELNRLLDDCQKGDILLIESIDRLTRLTDQDWATLRGRIDHLGVCIVAVDLPTSHTALNTQGDSITDSILKAINNMMIDIMAVMARKDYELRRQRQAQGIKKAQQQGKFKGRQADLKQYKTIVKMAQSGLTYKQISDTLKCSPNTVSKAIKWHGGIDRKQLTFSDHTTKPKKGKK